LLRILTSASPAKHGPPRSVKNKLRDHKNESDYRAKKKTNIAKVKCASLVLGF